MKTPACDRRTETLQAAITAVITFMERIEALEAAEDSNIPGTYPRECGAVKRASMDLTRALADLRKVGSARWYNYE